MHKITSGLALLVMILAALPATAIAGDCTNNSRKAWPFTEGEARTRVKNRTTATALSVALDRGDSEKSSQTIKPGEDFSKLSKFTWTSGKGTITVTLDPDPGSNNSKCVYEIDKGENYVKWQIPSDADAVCPQVNELSIACEKSYNKDKSRFTTTYTVTDP
jgi:hypothetical protein